MPPLEKDMFNWDVPTEDGIVKIRGRMIKSSNIKWIGWPLSPLKGPLMIVEFQNGGRYAYMGVTRQRAVACAFAESSAAYLNKEIKPKFRCVKLR